MQNAIAAGRWKAREETAPKHVARTFAMFLPHYLDVICPARKDKPSFIETKRSFLRKHIVPVIGEKRLDEIASSDILKLMDRLKHMKPGSINNCLATVTGVLKAAVDAGEIARVPCEVPMLRVRESQLIEFYSLGEYHRLLAAAARLSQRTLAAVLLGGDAGLRIGEVTELRWSDLDLEGSHPHVNVRRTAWRHTSVLPKGNVERAVPLTCRLVSALKDLQRRARRQLVDTAKTESPIPLADYRGEVRFLFCGPSGQRVQPGSIRLWTAKAQAAAGLRASGKFHVLRHTFCTHLAAEGAPPLHIKELAGHRSLGTTEKYMHLLPGAKERAIALLDNAGDPENDNQAGHTNTKRRRPHRK